MNRYQIRRRVQGLLRDDTFPPEVLNEALNRVIMEINAKGRYRFQQGSTTLAMVTNTYKYSVPTDLLGEKILLWKAGTSDQAIIVKFPDPIDEILQTGFVNTGNAPTTYIRWANQFWFDPIPNSVANGNNVTVLYFKDLAELTGDLDTPTVPSRYHGTVLVYGVANDVAPGLMVRTPEGNMTVSQAYARVLGDFHKQEYWEPNTTRKLVPDLRWNGSEKWGNVSLIR